VHIDVDIAEWTSNQLIIRPLDQTQLEQYHQIVMYPTHIALYPSGDLPYSDRPISTLKFTYQVPTAFRQFAEQYSW
jgi:hypothetical protein